MQQFYSFDSALKLVLSNIIEENKMMQMTINVPDTLPAEFLKLRIQELEQNLINET